MFHYHSVMYCNKGLGEAYTFTLENRSINFVPISKCRSDGISQHEVVNY